MCPCRGSVSFYGLPWQDSRLNFFPSQRLPFQWSLPLSSNSQSLFSAFCSPQYKCLIAVFPEHLLGIFAFFRPSSLRSSLGKGGHYAGWEAGGDTRDKDSPGTCSLRLGPELPTGLIFLINWKITFVLFCCCC